MSKTKRSEQWITKQKKYIGFHLLAEFWGGKIIENSKEIEEILFTAAKKAKNTPLKISIHKFNPAGITAVILLAESHIAIHSWPEMDYMAVDIFTCGDKASPQKALLHLKEKFQPKKLIVKEINRGKFEI